MNFAEIYTDVNGREWSYTLIVAARHSAYPIEDILIPEDKKRFEEKYDKNQGVRCSTCGRR